MKNDEIKPSKVEDLDRYGGLNYVHASKLADGVDLRRRSSWSDELNQTQSTKLQDYSKYWDPAALKEWGKLGGLVRYIADIRASGYFEAHTNPLAEPKLGQYNRYIDDLGIDVELLDMPASNLTELNGFVEINGFSGTVRDLIEMLQKSYCGKTGYEFGHIRDTKIRKWLYEQVEHQHPSTSKTPKKQLQYVYQMLLRAEIFEQFLHKAYPGQRWYSLEGLEGALLLTNQLVIEAINDGIDNLILGMAHRGRLNFLTHILNKPYEMIIDEFSDMNPERLMTLEHRGWLIDVKYHQGADFARDWDHDGSQDIKLQMMPNPSHLELISASVLGAVRAVQDVGGSGLAILMHGDAAFAGQGIVLETLNMADLEGYKTGGTIHVVMNNQIGFTTSPADSFSGMNATDVVRGFDIPILRVNADSVWDCIAAAQLAAKYRNEFKKDILIDLVGYRRYGHNESDDPSVTHPQMYKKIAEHPTLLTIFGNELIEKGMLSEAKFEQDKADILNHFFEIKNEREQKQKNSSNGNQINQAQARPDLGRTRLQLGSFATIDSKVDAESLETMNTAMYSTPDQFVKHPLVSKLLKKRITAFKNDQFDWGHAENLAFGTLVKDGFKVRLTGQDSVRGTFSQRHSKLYDYNTNATFNPVEQVKGDGQFEIYNSPLSEASVLAFEYGYSAEATGTLVIWEAQFGDFVNNAQSVVDELIVSGKAKWGQPASVVLLLPHGYEGQGPNHSSAHLERFLSLAASSNMRITVPTTAAQYFHTLRAHAMSLKNSPLPMVVVTGKSLLRHPLAASTIKELSDDGFQPIRLFVPNENKQTVSKIVMCSGKVFVDLMANPSMTKARNVMFMCIEELYPLPISAITSELKKLPNHQKLTYYWLQEEPRNRGAFKYIDNKRHLLIGDNKFTYIGRPATSSAAEGASWLHKMEQKALLEEAICV